MICVNQDTLNKLARTLSPLSSCIFHTRRQTYIRHVKQLFKSFNNSFLPKVLTKIGKFIEYPVKIRFDPKSFDFSH